MKEYIRKVVEVLRKGGIILYPTDTVWGIGCDATNPEAIEKIYNLKKNTDKKAMLVLVNHIDMVSRYTNKVPSVAWDLAELADKPLTIIYPEAAALPDNLIPDDGSIGIRIVTSDFCNELLKALRKPLVSTSANISGNATPRSFSEISKEIIEGVDLVIDNQYAGKMTGKPSSIIKIGANGEIQIIR